MSFYPVIIKFNVPCEVQDQDNDNDNDNDNDFISSQNSTVCSVDLTIKILQKEYFLKQYR